MRWALMMIRLAAACRNTSVNRTTGTAPELMMSAKTCPGPTDGSWSISPTINSAALSGVAFMSACISMTSTIEASSTTSRSQSRGLSALRLNPPLLGSTSKSRWIVAKPIGLGLDDVEDPLTEGPSWLKRPPTSLLWCPTVYDHAARLRFFELIAQVSDADHSQVGTSSMSWTLGEVHTREK